MGLIGRKAQQKKNEPQAAPPTTTRTFTATVDGHVLGVCAFENDVFALTGEGELHRWQQGKDTHEVFAVHKDGALSFAHDAAKPCLVTGGMDGTITVFMPSTRESKTVRVHASAWIESLAISEMWIAASAARSVYLIHRETFEVRTLGPHKSTVTAIAFGGDGKFLAAARNGGVDYWNIESGTARELAWSSSIVSVACSPTGDYVAGGCQDDAVHFWRLSTQEDSMMSGYPSKPKHVAFAYDGSLLCTSAGRELVTWNFRGRGPEGTAPIVLEGHDDSVQSLARAPGTQHFVSGAKDGSIALWRPSKSKSAWTTAAMQGSVEAVNFAGSDTRLVAGTSTGDIAVFEVTELR